MMCSVARTLFVMALLVSWGERRAVGAADAIRVEGRRIAVPAPRGLVNLFGPGWVPAAGRAMLSSQDWKLVYVPEAAAVAMRENPRGGFDRSHVAMIVVPDGWNSGQDPVNATRFGNYRDAATRYARTWHTSFSDSIARACAAGGSDRRGRRPTAPTVRMELRLMRVGGDAVGWLALGSDGRRPPMPGTAEIVATGQMLVRDRQLGFVYGRTCVPSCAEIDAIERDAREWIEAVLAANR